MIAVDIRGRVRAVPAGCWLGVVVVAGFVLLVWHDWYSQADEDASWLDDGQPALQLDAVSQHIPSTRPRSREYPGCLSGWSGTKIGDC